MPDPGEPGGPIVSSDHLVRALALVDHLSTQDPKTVIVTLRSMSPDALYVFLASLLAHAAVDSVDTVPSGPSAD